MKVTSGRVTRMGYRLTVNRIIVRYTVEGGSVFTNTGEIGIPLEQRQIVRGASRAIDLHRAYSMVRSIRQ